MGPEQLEHCENCGCRSRFVPLFDPSCSTCRCLRCGGWSYTGKVTREPRELYDREYFFGGEYQDYSLSVPSQRKNYARMLNLLERRGCGIGAGARVLEVGSATGEFLSLLDGITGVRSLGIEVSPFGLAEARARGLSVLAPDDPDLARALHELQPNFILAWDVWEHLPHPATTFSELMRHAASGLVVAATTVDAGSAVARVRGKRWRQFHPPTHLHYPTRRSFQDFFAGHSLQIVAQQAVGFHRPLLEYTLALGVRLPGAAQLLSTPIYLNLWDTQLVMARRSA